MDPAANLTERHIHRSTRNVCQRIRHNRMAGSPLPTTGPMSHEAGTKLAHTSPTAIESRSTPKSFDLWNLKAQPPTTAANAHSQTHSTPSATRTSASAASTPAPRPTTTGPSKTHSTPHSSNKSTPDSKTTASSESSSPQQNSPPPPKFGLHRILETATPPHTSAGTQMANIIAWAAHQHLTHHDQPNFCWDLYQDLRHIDIYGEPLAIDTETHWAEVEYASTTTESTR